MALRGTDQDRELEALRRRVAELERAHLERDVPATVPENGLRAEDLALRESEERFRTLVANVPGAVYRCQVHWPYRDILLSEGVEAITGYRAAEHLARAELDFGSRVFAEDRERIERAVEVAITSREAFTLRYRIRHANGTLRWVQEQGRATYDDAGVPLFLDGVLVDITSQILVEHSLRDREERLRAIVESEPECVKLLDREGNLIEMNPAGLRMIEADSLEQVRGQCVCPLILPADEPAFREMLAGVFQGEPRTLVFDVVGFKGTRRTLETTAVPLWDDAEHLKVRALLGITRDITERREAEQMRQALESQLRQAQKMEAIGTLAGGIAHDFNNILTAIIGHAELLVQDLPPTPVLHEEVAGILSASQRARDLVQQILTFSRRREQERRLIALQPAVLEALRMLRATLPTSIEMRTEIATEETLVLADATQVHQVVVNLCTNAAHAMREGGGVLAVRYCTVQADEIFAPSHQALRPGRYLRLTVSDTGHGMDPEVIERIFDPFFTTKGPGEGTGLGLAVLHGIMQNHDGLVTVHSRPGKGSSFNLYFPAAAGTVPEGPTEKPGVTRGSGEHILVVDDEPALVVIARRALSQIGYQVTGHTQPAEALAEFERDPQKFDLVLCDLTMPQMSGLDFAAQLFRIRPEIPVVLTSGYGGSLGTESLQRLGIRELLGKPFTIRSLAEAADRNLKAVR